MSAIRALCLPLAAATLVTSGCSSSQNAASPSSYAPATTLARPSLLKSKGNDFNFTLDNESSYDIEQGTSSSVCMYGVPQATTIKSKAQLTTGLESNESIFGGCANNPVAYYQFVTEYVTKDRKWRGVIDWSGVRWQGEVKVHHYYTQGINFISAPNGTNICAVQQVPKDSWGFGVKLYDCPVVAKAKRPIRVAHGQTFRFTVDNETPYNIEQGTSSSTCMNVVPQPLEFTTHQRVTNNLEASGRVFSGCNGSPGYYEFVTEYVTGDRSWRGFVDWSGYSPFIGSSTRAYFQDITFLAAPNSKVRICADRDVPQQPWGFSIKLYKC